MFRSRRVLRRSGSTLTDRQWTRLLHAVEVGGGSGQLQAAWLVAQELMLLFACSHDHREAARRLHDILDRCVVSDLPELHRLGQTLDTWRAELLAGWTNAGRRPVSNGPTEAVNALIEKVQRIGHGFRNFDNYRIRLLLAFGLDWDTVPWRAVAAIRLRGCPLRFMT